MIALFLDSTPIMLDSSTSVQPFLFDFDGDMTTDLLGYPSSQGAGGDSILSVWLNQAKNSQTSTPFKMYVFLFVV